MASMDTDTDMPMNATEERLFNPLDIDLGRSVQGLLQSCSESLPALADQDARLFRVFVDDPNAVSRSELLDTLSKCMLSPQWTRAITTHFRPIVIDLVARWTTPNFTVFLDATPKTNQGVRGTVHRIEAVAKAFSVILPIAPQVQSLAVTYFTHSISLFERLDRRDHTDVMTEEEDLLALQDLLLTAYRLLRFSRSTFTSMWNWGSLVKLLQSSYACIRYYTVLCLSMVYLLGDAHTSTLLDAVADNNEGGDTPLMATVDGARVDLRMLRLLEQQRLANEQIAFVHNNFIDNHSSASSLTDSDLCPLTCNLCGVLLPKRSQKSTSDRTPYHPRLIQTHTTKRNIHAIGLALSIGAPTLLEGITGAGKTSLIEELASRTGRGDQLVKIHLGDQTDPKVLLGTYVSTSTPGSFRWQAGVLTTAVQEGRWVLIEDIDLAPAEVISVLLPLLETRQLFIPSRGEKIKAKEGFQLFGTRSLLPSRSGKGTSSRGGELVTGANLWTRVHVNPLSPEELESVVRQKFAHIGDFSKHVMTLFETVTNVYQDPHFSSLSSSTAGRFISTRDLMKWCRRIDTLLGSRVTGQEGDVDTGLDEAVRQDLFSEAIDCFCGMIPDYTTWVAVLERVGEPLQISKDRVRHYVDQYKPAFEVGGNVVRIGRVNLSSMAASGRQRQQQAMIKREKQRPFATTGHALRLLEKIAVSVHLTEPVLLVGETGTGKTTVVQHLADMMNQNLIVVNLSQQSDSSDLLGGFKPVDGKVLAIPLRDEFERLFEKTFSIRKNEKFLIMARKTFVQQKWPTFVALLKRAVVMSQEKFESEHEQASKKTSLPQLRSAWRVFSKRLEEFEVQQTQSHNKFVFSFMEGSLVKAVRRGDWILLDEINLATTETLECLSGLLQDAQGSLLLTEKGDIEPIQRHPNFRLFACMNPATDVGKRDLPPGLRNRFTEFYVHPPDSRYEDLLQIVRQYLMGVATGDERVYGDVAEFYMEAKNLALQHKLVDGANQRPHFSMRTLARALTYVVQIYPTYGLRRSLYEGFSMTFLTQLSKESEAVMSQLIFKTILRDVKNPTHLVSQIPRQPTGNFVRFGPFWLEKGQSEAIDDPHYILTQSVETKLHSVARVVMSRKFPVLIQGPTSAGKTSMIEYLAKKTGHRFVRINNHEHTDLQEYLGTYISNAEGQLVFQEGVLVEALRNGYWIVLDELNLAPSDVLEALNRLLDDNRELLIPETQEVVKPHPHFMLFATQNPAGLYGGRKALSRAFRNRFLELHFDDIPEDELETILSRRCRIAPSYCKKLVEVYQTLMARRQSTRIFEQKHGFITLRDLFRWAGRDPNGYQELAEHGYMLLAERCRRDEEKKVVKQVLETVMKAKLDEATMYDSARLEEFAVYDALLREKSAQSGQDTKLVWTKAMRRLFSLVAQCLRHKEPVLLVGDTGCGKTTVCQMLAEAYSRELHIVNCHQNTETGDLLGGQRPVRNRSTLEDDKQQKLFEWHDGPLVHAMREGHLFLLDEISLADDSVLERLNSVLEPSRLLVLAEKGGKHVEELRAEANFQFLATMNPGGDYGKKELSPALRNRFTEIWVPSVSDRDDLTMIIKEQMATPSLEPYGEKMLDFIAWYTQTLGQTRTVVSLRDILSWVKFLNTAVGYGLDPKLAFAHGGCLVLLDGLGSHGSSGSLLLAGNPLKELRLKCLRHLADDSNGTEQSILGSHDVIGQKNDHQFAIGAFHIPYGPAPKTEIKFTLLAPTTADNAMRVVRAMQLQKPILLEGSPGVGKTSLISALAAATSHHLVRINLSEQTDLMDLFGSDLPVEGGNSGEFAWRDAPFLQAMKSGDWVLLDELNLASQSVLEGLNSCLDHRGAVYVPELDREFFCAKGFRVFGAQNPLQQGGGRKGLPKSFVNRFTQVYVEHLTADDLLFICAHLFPAFEPSTLSKMIEFNAQMYDATMVRCRFGRKGSPWEFNLRDVFRWLELMQRDGVKDPAEFLDIIYMQRMRTREDRLEVVRLFESVFSVTYDRPDHPQYDVSVDYLTVGHSRLPRKSQERETSDDGTDRQDHILQSFLSPMEALIKCVESSWMAIVTGPSASGKTSLVRLLSKLTGNKLEEFAMNNSVDTMELLGGFEQVDVNRHREVVMDMLRQLTQRTSKRLLMMSCGRDSASSAELLSHVRLINGGWHALESRYGLQSTWTEANPTGLDYTLVSNLVNALNAVVGDDGASRSAVDAVVTAVQNLQCLEKDSIAGKFEWIDGLLIHALEQGHWLLIDNANLCNPSVLDRLNPLFENDGVLMVNERGLVDGTVKVIRPHPNFRMFMTVDPQNGELSRAMRNRGIEIALVDSGWNRNEVDVGRLANTVGVRGGKLPLLLNQLQDHALTQYKTMGKNKNVRDYLLLATYIVERLQRGQSIQMALCDAFRQVFVDAKELPPALTTLLASDVTADTWLQDMMSPANCPFLIGGSMFQEDSALAMVSLQGAYLLYLLQTSASDAKIDVASDYFLESLGLNDYGLRMRWLAFMAQNQSMNDAMTSALERLGFIMRSVHAHPSFTELMHAKEGQSPLTAEQGRETYRLLVRKYKQDYTSKIVYNASQRIKTGSLSVVQQSYCLDKGRLGETELLHPVVASLYPLFESISEGVMAWIDQASYRTCPLSTFEALRAILDTRDYAWSLVQLPNLSLDNLLITLRILKGMLLPTDAVIIPTFSATVETIDTIMAGFDFETCKSMKALWKHFCPATLSSESLYNLEEQLHKINATMDVYRPEHDQELTAQDKVLIVKTDIKEALVEGLATLYAINDNSDKDAAILEKSLKHLPEHLCRQLEVDSLTQISSVAAPWMTALIPLYDYASITQEMEIVARLYAETCHPSYPSDLTNMLAKMRAFKYFCAHRSSRPPLDLVPYQRLVWTLDPDQPDKDIIGLPGMVHDAAHTWHSRLWRSGVHQKSLYELAPSKTEKEPTISRGSLCLFEGAETLACLNILGSVDQMPAEAYNSALEQIKALKDYLANAIYASDKRALELVMLVSMACQLLYASADMIPTDIYQTLRYQVDQWMPFVQALLSSTVYTSAATPGQFREITTSMAEMVRILQEAEFNSFYIRAIDALQNCVTHFSCGAPQQFYTVAGKTRVLLGLAFVHTYIPDYPVDPTAEPRLRVNLLLRAKEACTDTIHVRTEIEKLTTGNASNPTIHAQSQALANVDAALAANATTFSLRPTKSQLDEIFVDLQYLQKSMLQRNIESLLSDLEQGGSTSAVQREELLQGNALQFIDRIHQKYPLYRDILQPLVVAVQDIQYGLRVMTRAGKKNAADDFLASVVELLLRNPDVSRHPHDLDWHQLSDPNSLERLKSVIFERAATNRKWAFYLRLLIVMLQRLVMAVHSSGYLRPEDMVSLSTLFNEIVQIWKSAREYKRQKEAEKEQLYKTRAKKYEPITEEELEEQDLKKTFADFSEAFADLEDHVEQTAVPKQVEEMSVLDDADVHRIGRLHKQIFTEFGHDMCHRSTKTWDSERLELYGAAGQLAEIVSCAFSDAMDPTSSASHLRIAALTIDRLESEQGRDTAKAKEDMYDFYQSENIGETKRVEPVVLRFKARVQFLLEEWPEHAVLHQLVVLCDRLLGFTVASPVAKFLTGVEILLQKSEDWESYAAKHVSLKDQRDELVALIVRWRQLELNCWPKLLDAQERYHQDAAFSWWFELYDAVNTTKFDTGSEEDNAKNVRNLLTSLDHFMQVASLIEFEPRLRMIDSFYQQTRLRAKLALSEELARDDHRVSTILRNVYLYYLQFQDHVHTTLAQLRKPIEKELKAFVKIASWKDVNIHALRQSAKKTHRQLHKCIRKYREVLGNSMLSIIANYDQESAMFQYGDEKRYNDVKSGFIQQLSHANLWLTSTVVPNEGSAQISSATEVKRHLVHLPTTLNRLQRYCRQDVFKPLPEEPPMESFMTEIIQQIKQFQKETPAEMTDENKSLVKNQKMLKKKALVDFLKELKRLGLRWHSHGLAEQNADTSRLFVMQVAALESVLRPRKLQNDRLSSFSTASQDMLELWQKANTYYFRSIARMTHLRTLSTTEVSKDLSRLEVERSMSATEHMFSLVTKERSILSLFEKRMHILQGVSVQLASLYASSTAGKPISNSLDLGCRLTAHKMHIDAITHMLSEAILTVQLQVSESLAKEAPLRLSSLCDTVKTMQKSTDHAFAQRCLYPQSATGLSYSLLSSDISDILEAHRETLYSLQDTLKDVMSTLPQSNHVLDPILHYLSTTALSSVAKDGSQDAVRSECTLSGLQGAMHSLVDAILVSIQDLKKEKAEPVEKKDAEEEEEEEEEEEDRNEDMPEGYIRSQHGRQFTLTNALHLDTVSKRCLDVLEKAFALSVEAPDVTSSVSRVLQDVYPFLQQYMLVVQHTLSEILLHHKSMAKLTFALVNSFSIIISKGFCMPEGAADEEGEADGMMTGTGIGEGEGTKDVSEEIEDEEQVLGTQNEEKQKDEKKDTKEEKNGMDMENDFEGDLEDVEQDEEDQDEKSDGSDEEEEELDDEIGDVDDMDPDAVDDKMWGEEGEENLNESEKTVDQEQPQGEQESDIVAKDEKDQPQDSKEKKKEKETQAKGEEVQEEDQPGEEEEGGEDEGEGEGEDEDEGQDNPSGEQLNAEIPEAETLDLPEDMNLDGGDEEDGASGPEEEGDPLMDAMDADDGEPPAEEDDAFVDPLDQVEKGELDQDGQEDEEMHDGAAQVEGEGEDEDEEEDAKGQGEDAKEDEEPMPEDTSAMEAKGGQMDDQEMEMDEDAKAQNHEHPDQDASADNQFGVQGNAGKTNMSSVGHTQGENEASESTDMDTKDEKKEQQGPSDRGANPADKAEEAQGEKEQGKQPEMNPQRSLGDALENWRRRLADVSDAVEEEEEDKEAAEQNKEAKKEDADVQVREDQAFEYVKEDEEAHDMQTLGNAAADQLQDLSLGVMDEEMAESEQASGEMETEQPATEVDTMPLPRETLEMAGNREAGGAMTSKQLALDKDESVLTVDESIVAHEPLDQQDIERIREELEMQVSEWREEGRDLDKARTLWQSYENLTHDLAMGLCEQLRLILEPTLATKLKGDYRTGKRLNMKKIIPYIASQFKKDKIWLRRTKPSKRQYQIMIAVDDSKSMSESHSVQLAYETLSLISKALSQLEVGDISIASFGERIRLLHPFDQPFTAASGASVLQQFTFAQQKTYVTRMMETSLALFENARHSMPAQAELWQLQLVISDGICEDHDTLKALVRRALEQHVMIIFIVVDNKPEKDSIMNMTNVKYTTTNGKLSLQMQPYLQTFPFEYFMILRDINALPEALSDALRQYFSFVAS